MNKNHTKVYAQAMGYTDIHEFVCEITGGQGRDIHHLDARGMGGSKLKDTIENLQCLKRELHDMAEAMPHLGWWFKKTHKWFLENSDIGTDRRQGYMENRKNQFDPFGRALVGSEVIVPLKSEDIMFISNMGHVYRGYSERDRGRTFANIPEMLVRGRLTKTVRPQAMLALMSKKFFGNAALRFFDEDHDNFHILNLVPDFA